MKALVIGLGSMGKRRVRNLIANGITNIFGFDPREDRRNESIEKYSIKTIISLNKAEELKGYDLVVISTPPDLHMHYAFMAFSSKVPMFIEASVTDIDKIRELDSLNLGSVKPIIIAPSCTMRYFPGPKLIKELIRDKAIGNCLYLTYITGQYLPDWHPWEGIDEFYVSKKETGGAREILPFELTWLNDIWGLAEVKTSLYRKLSNLTADIDDYYTTILEYPEGMICNLTVEVLSRPLVSRELRIIGTEGFIKFSADSNTVKLHTVGKDGKGASEKSFDLGLGTVEDQYINPEEPYIQEISAFLHAVNSSDQSLYPNTLADDIAVLEMLLEVEQKAQT